MLRSRSRRGSSKWCFAMTPWDPMELSSVRSPRRRCLPQPRKVGTREVWHSPIRGVSLTTNLCEYTSRLSCAR